MNTIKKYLNYFPKKIDDFIKRLRGAIAEYRENILKMIRTPKILGDDNLIKDIEPSNIDIELSDIYDIPESKLPDVEQNNTASKIPDIEPSDIYDIPASKLPDIEPTTIENPEDLREEKYKIFQNLK